MKTKSSNLIYKGKIISVYKDEIEINGISAMREVVKHNGGCAILAERDGKFLFVKQFRYAIGKEIIEIPAGTCESDEEAYATARRELIEECGLDPINLKYFCKFCVSPGYDTEYIHLFYSNTFKESYAPMDDDEELTSVWIDKEQAFKMAENGEIFDGKTLIALMYYKAGLLNQ